MSGETRFVGEQLIGTCARCGREGPVVSDATNTCGWRCRDGCGPTAPDEYRDGFLAGWASGWLAATGERPWSVVHEDRAAADYARVNAKRRPALVSGLRWEVTRLRSALENWGRHHPWCVSLHRPELPCACGLAAILAETAPESAPILPPNSDAMASGER